jgi:hypothetical protein
MRDWIVKKERYVRPDFAIAELVFGLFQEHMEALTMDDVFAALFPGSEDARLLASSQEFTRAAAWNLQKKQLTTADYKRLADVTLDGDSSPTAFSRRRMTELVLLRVRYLLQRGATLNNPHIPNSYFVRTKGILPYADSLTPENVRSKFIEFEAADLRNDVENKRRLIRLVELCRA